MKLELISKSFLFKRSLKKEFDSTNDYRGVVGRFQGHSEAADLELEQYLIRYFQEEESVSSFK